MSKVGYTIEADGAAKAKNEIADLRFELTLLTKDLSKAKKDEDRAGYVKLTRQADRLKDRQKVLRTEMRESEKQLKDRQKVLRKELRESEKQLRKNETLSKKIDNFPIEVGGAAKAKNEIADLRFELTRLAKDLSKAKKDKDRAGYVKLTREADRLKDRQKVLRTEVRELEKQYKNNKETLTNMVDNFRIGGISVGRFKGAIRNVSGAIKLNRKALLANIFTLKAFRIALAATGIGFLVIVLGSLVLWFTRTQKGMDLVARAGAVVTAVLDTIIERAIKFGSGLINIFRGNLAKGFKELGASIQGLGSDLIETGKAADVNKKAIQDLTREQKNLELETKKVRAVEKDLSLIAEDTTASAKERGDAAAEGIRIEQELLEKRLEFQHRVIDSLKEEARLKGTLLTDEDTFKIIDAEGELATLREESVERQTTLNSKLNVANQALSKGTEDFVEGSLTDLNKLLSEVTAKIAGGDLSDQNFLDKLGLEKTIIATTQALEDLKNSFKSLDDLIAEADLITTVDIIEGESTLADFKKRKEAEKKAEGEISFEAFQKRKAAQKKGDDERIAELKAHLEEKGLQEQEQIEARIELERLLEEKARREKIAVTQGFIDSLSTITGTLAALGEARTDKEIAAIERKYQRDIDLAEGNSALIEELEGKLAEEKEKILRREFERKKKLEIASAGIQFAQGILNIFAAPTTIPDPFGKIFKAIQVGALAGVFAAQVSKISSQQFARGGQRAGEVLQGPSHGGGGIPLEEGEGGEVIINKRSSAAFMPLLDAVNSHKGWGKRLMRRGGITTGNSIPNFVSLSSGGSTGNFLAGSTTAVIADESASALADTVGAAVRRSIALGLTDNARINERRLILEQTTHI